MLVTSNALCMSVMVYVSGCCLILMSHDQMQRTKANESQVCLLVCNIHLQLSIGLSLCSQDSPRLHGLGLNFLVSNIIVQAAYLGFRWIIPRKMKTRLTFRFWHVIGAELEQCCLPWDFRRQILQCVCLGYLLLIISSKLMNYLFASVIFTCINWNGRHMQCFRIHY